MPFEIYEDPAGSEAEGQSPNHATFAATSEPVPGTETPLRIPGEAEGTGPGDSNERDDAQDDGISTQLEEELQNTVSLHTKAPGIPDANSPLPTGSGGDFIETRDENGATGVDDGNDKDKVEASAKMSNRTEQTEEDLNDVDVLDRKTPTADGKEAGLLPWVIAASIAGTALVLLLFLLPLRVWNRWKQSKREAARHVDGDPCSDPGRGIVEYIRQEEPNSETHKVARLTIDRGNAPSRQCTRSSSVDFQFA